MHPRTFLDSHWRNDLRDEVFVAMSMSPAYDDRWQFVIRPAIEGQPIRSLRLRARRVDTQRSGDSILTDIIDGIAHAQLILADISVTHAWQDGAQERHERNGNVMYEVGLALAIRQPVEVILLRDDGDALLFDVSTIPVLRIDAHDHEGSVARIREALTDRLAERLLTRDLRVTRALESLGPFEFSIIKSNPGKYDLAWKGGGGISPAVADGVPGLLGKGILRRVEDGSINYVYTYTTLGRVVAEIVCEQPGT